VTRPTCPREGCANQLLAGQVVCTGDFTALAGMCRSKKRLGQPAADEIAAARNQDSYCCRLCREFHTGQPARRAELLMSTAGATVEALRADPRVGPAGLLSLADAWHPQNPGNVNRSCWHQGLDQTAMLCLPL
jgi:hypothetical protein